MDKHREIGPHTINDYQNGLVKNVHVSAGNFSPVIANSTKFTVWTLDKILTTLGQSLLTNVIPKREKILVESSLKNVNEVFVGRRPTINYVMATMMILNKGKEVTVKARGRAISHAVEVCEVLKNRFLKGTEYKEIEISTDQLEGEDGRSSNISTIKIVLAPPE